MTKFHQQVDGFKMYLVLNALDKCRWNQSAAARELGIHRNDIGRMMRQFAIKRKPALRREGA